MQSIPGIGPVVARKLIADLSELGTLTAKQVAALAGLAPYPRESGARIGQRRIRPGLATARRALFLGALAASRFNASMKMFHTRLIAQGKAKKVALVALARKLVILANTIVRKDRMWTAHPA